MNSKLLVFALSTLSLVSPTLAHADANSLLTLGVGTSLSFSQGADPNADARSSMSPDLDLRLRLFRVMAVDFSYSMMDSTPVSAQLSLESRMRVSAVLYLIPLEAFGVYAKAGIGGNSFGDLVTVTSATNSYHAGGGLEVYLTDHIALGAEFLLLAPGATSIQKTVANDALRRQALRQAGADDATSEPQLGVSDFIGLQNFRSSVSARYFF